MEQRNFIVLGGDNRNLELVNLLYEDGHNVLNLVEIDIHTIDLKDHEIIIGPLPFSHDNETINALSDQIMEMIPDGIMRSFYEGIENYQMEKGLLE